MVKVVKEQDQEGAYIVIIYDFDNKQKMQIFWGGNGDLYWTLRGPCDDNNIVMNESDGEIYTIFNKMYNGIINSKDLPAKPISLDDDNRPLEDEDINVGDVRKYDEYSFYDPIEQSINYGTEETYFDESIGTGSLIKAQNSYAIRFKGEFDFFSSIRICFSGSRYGHFPMFYAQCYNRLLKIAKEDPKKVNDEFNRLIKSNPKQLEK